MELVKPTEKKLGVGGRKYYKITYSENHLESGVHPQSHKRNGDSISSSSEGGNERPGSWAMEFLKKGLRSLPPVYNNMWILRGYTRAR